MSYKVELSKSAKKDLKKLDIRTSSLIINWLRKNLEGCSNPRQHGKHQQATTLVNGVIELEITELLLKSLMIRLLFLFLMQVTGEKYTNPLLCRSYDLKRCALAQRFYFYMHKHTKRAASVWKQLLNFLNCINFANFRIRRRSTIRCTKLGHPSC